VEYGLIVKWVVTGSRMAHSRVEMGLFQIEPNALNWNC
jgi:hypothetical protein